MTTYFQTTARCSHCNTESSHTVLGSTNAFGSADLDLRPPEMQRSTMRAWLQQCPSCGYVAPDLSAPVPDPAVLASSAYRGLLTDERFPELCRRFLARGSLLAGSSAAEAAHAFLSAAWACDDARLAEQAAACRGRAADHFERLKPFPDTQPGLTQGAVYVDVLRRAGQFAEAEAQCEALLACAAARDVLQQVLLFQQRLIQAKDAGCYTVQQAVTQAG